MKEWCLKLELAIRRRTNRRPKWSTVRMDGHSALMSVIGIAGSQRHLLKSCCWTQKEVWLESGSNFIFTVEGNSITQFFCFNLWTSIDLLKRYLEIWNDRNRNDVIFSGCVSNFKATISNKVKKYFIEDILCWREVARNPNVFDYLQTVLRGTTFCVIWYHFIKIAKEIILKCVIDSLK